MEEQEGDASLLNDDDKFALLLELSTLLGVWYKDGFEDGWDCKSWSVDSGTAWNDLKPILEKYEVKRIAHSS